MGTASIALHRGHDREYRTLGRFALLAVAAIALVHAGTAFGPTVWAGLTGIRASTLSRPAPIDLLAILTDSTPVTVTTTQRWVKVRQAATIDAVLHDRSLWRRMHFDDWDKLPTPLRTAGLRAVIGTYDRVLRGPRVWRGMTAADWDLVPQPVRAMAYLRMVRFWSSREFVAVEFGLEPLVVAQTIGAIVMSESWFEHRAVNENPWGNRDLGLAQCSDYCRAEIDRMAERGEIASALTEPDYFDPFIATRVATLWFQRELRRAGGDVDLAIRAYHRGLDAALDARGDTYLARVRANRARFIRNGTQSSASWRYLMASAGAPALPSHR